MVERGVCMSIILTDNELIREDLKGIHSITEHLEKSIEEHKDLVAVTDAYNELEMTYQDVQNLITQTAGGLQHLGINKGDFVCLFTENNGYFMSMAQAIIKTGAIDVLRGSNAPNEELDYIMGHSEPKGVIIYDMKLLNKLKDSLNARQLNFIIVLNKKDFSKEGLNAPVYTLDEIIEMGRENPFTPVEINLADSATIFYYYTKGCHLHFTNISNLKNDLLRYKIDTMMSVPRIWEAFRLGIYQKLKQNSKLGYFLFDFAVQNSINYKIHKMYSERRLTNKKTSYKLPSNIYHKIARAFLKPLHVLATKTIYKKVKEAAGLDRIRLSISGGGALSLKDELFYDAIGVNLRIGYGLTETSPVLTLRGIQYPNYLGCVGKPYAHTKIKIVDPQTMKKVRLYTKGLVLAKGPQVMNGYYKDEEATKKVFTEDGWFITGDLGWLTRNNNLVLVGRQKETIVLSSGENVEPIPIEEAILESPYIDQIVLVGQDEASVGALIVPSKMALDKCGILAKELKSGKTLSIKNPNLRELMKKEIQTYIKNKTGLKPFEKVKEFEVLKDGFSMDNGLLSQTAKVKRNVIFEKYQDIINKMFKK